MPGVQEGDTGSDNRTAKTVPFALGVSPPIVIGTFKRRTPQANGATTRERELPGRAIVYYTVTS